MVRIVTDSTSDINQDLAKSLGITIVPLTVFFDKQSFLDRVEMTTDEFYQRLVGEIFPTTTQPSPGVFAEVYNQLAKETNEIAVVTISGKLSGTYQSALSAVSMVKKKGVKIEVIDSQSTAMGLGLIAMHAAQKAKAGANLEEVASTIRADINKSHPYMYFETLKYLVKGGRIGKAKGLAGSLLSIKPIMTLDEGEVTDIARVRSKRAGLGYLFKYVNNFADNIEALAVEHAANPKDADMLVERLAEIYPKEKIIRSTISPVLGTYMGPNIIGVFVLEK